MTGELGFVALHNGATMPGADVDCFGAFSFPDGKLQPNTLDGKEPSTCEANASDIRVSNGPSAGGGLCAMSEDYFTPLFEGIVQRYGVVGAAVFGRIHRYASASGKCTASAQTIADDLRMDVATVKRWTAMLVTDGLLTKDWSKGRTAVYRIGQPSAESANPTKRTKRQVNPAHKAPRVAQKALGVSAESAITRELPENTNPEAVANNATAGDANDASPGAEPGRMADVIDSATGLPSAPAADVVALVDGIEADNAKTPKPRPPNPWADTNEAYRLTFGLPAVASTWKLSSLVVAVLKEHQVAPGDGPATWARFVSAMERGEKWHFVQAHNAGQWLAKWLVGVKAGRSGMTIKFGGAQ